MKKKLFIFFLAVAVCAAALNAQTLELAIVGAAVKISRELPAGSSVAVINFQSGSENLNEHVLTELYGAILRNRSVIPVRPNARQFQTIQDGLNEDGELNGESAQSIGKLLGAQYLITGSITQNGYLYNIVFNAVDLKAELQSQYQASINPRNDPELVSFLSGKFQPSAGTASQPKPVTIADIAGVTAPATGKTPVKAIAENAQYAGTVTWSPEVSGTFEFNTQYTATITLTVKTGFTLQGVAANFFKVAGAASVSNNANAGVVTAVFPAATPSAVDIAAITGITVPKIKGIPVKTITETGQYGGTVEWSPAVSDTFAAATRYTATVTLTAKDGYTLQGVEANFFKVAGAASVSNNADTGVITVVFPPTKNPEDAKLKTFGVSIGTSFDTPLVIGTLHGTIAPFNGAFFELGADAGYGTNLDDVEYYSLYPFVNFALFVPFPRTADGKRGGWYAGAGAGMMFANYTFDVAGQVWDTVIAMNIVTGFNLFDMLDISYTIRTDFNLFNGKLSIGYVYRFK